MTQPNTTSLATPGFSGDPGVGGVAYRANGYVENLPKDAVEDLGEIFADLGTVTDAGVVHSITRDTEDQKDIAGRTYYVLQTSVDNSIVVTFADTLSADVLRTIVGDDNVEMGDDGKVVVHHNAKTMPRRTFVFDLLLANGIKRSLIEDGQVTSVGDVTHTSTQMLTYEVTIKAFSGPRTRDFVTDMYATEDGTIALGVSTGLIPAATANQEFSYKLTARGGSAPYTWSTDAALPEGLSLASDGTLSGTPTEAGSTEVEFKVTDGAGGVARKTLTVTVA